MNGEKELNDSQIHKTTASTINWYVVTLSEHILLYEVFVLI